MHERPWLHFLEDMIQSMERIVEYIQGYELHDFRKDFRTVDAVIRNFEVIGEASKNIPQEIKIKYQDVPWEEMYRLRNKITHEYFGIDYEIIWDIANNYIPANLKDLNEILKLES